MRIPIGKKQLTSIHKQYRKLLFSLVTTKDIKNEKKRIYKKKKRKTLALKTCKHVNTKIARRHF